jgi:rhodanese-related sulfurtransferase
MATFRDLLTQTKAQIREVAPSEADQRRADDPDTVFLDVREPDEFEQGAIPGAIHIPMHLLPLRAAELPRDTDLVLYCRSGARSYHACQFLGQQGFSNVINLRGGIIAWARHGYDIGRLEPR